MSRQSDSLAQSIKDLANRCISPGDMRRSGSDRNEVTKPWDAYIWREACRHHISYAVLSAILHVPGEAELITSSPGCATYGDWLEDRLSERLQTIIKEWPYDIPVEGMDKPQLAYTRNSKHGELDRQTITSPGKYLNRIFPEIPGHIIEQLSYPVPPKVEILTGEALIQAMYCPGPNSCMQPLTNRTIRDGARPFDVDPAYHPYRAYSEKHGWGMAASFNGEGLLVGRAIVHIPSKTWVRIFGNNDQHVIQADNPGLRYWLNLNGYRQVEGWQGRTLSYFPFFRDAFLAPYLDGTSSYGYIKGEDFIMDNTRGNALHYMHSTLGLIGNNVDSAVNRWKLESRKHELIKDWRGRMRHPDDMYLVNDGHIQGYVLRTSCVSDYRDNVHFKGHCVRLNCGEYRNHWALREETYKLEHGVGWLGYICLWSETQEWLNGRIHPKSVRAVMRRDEVDAYAMEAERSSSVNSFSQEAQNA